jgi:ferritin-like metal-binding protein YciE
LTARRGSTTRATASRTTEAPSKDDLVDRLDRRLRRLKREELQQLLEGVEAGRVNLAAVSGGVAGGRATIPAGTTGVAPSLARGAAKASAGTVKLDSLQDVLQEQIEDLYSAETQLVQALPKVAQAASTNELRQAFEQHLEETRGHVRRLEQIFGQVGISSPSEFCEGMEGLIREAEEIVAAKGDAAARDAALIAAAQRVEHYEIAGYGTARTLAEELGRAEAKRLLDETLDEEKNADALLTRLATGGRFGTGINEAAEETASDRS